MRPTIREQIRGIRLALRDVVAPEVEAAYPGDVLQGVIASLEQLEHTWDRVLPYLHWQNAELRPLLAEVATAVEPPLAGRIREALELPDPQPDEFDAAGSRNALLRGLLADAIPGLATLRDAAPVYARVRAHLRERMRRHPATTGGAPSGNAPANGGSPDAR